MHYFFFTIFLFLACVCTSNGQVIEGDDLGYLLKQRLPGYVESMPNIVQDVNQAPYKWVGYIYSMNQGRDNKEFASHSYCATGCSFMHPNFILTVAHVFFNTDGSLRNYDYYWVPRSNQQIIPGETNASKIRKIVIHDTVNGFGRLRKDARPIDYVDHDIACAIVYDKNEEFAIGYDPKQAQEAVSSSRTKIICGYFGINSIYAFNELNLDNSIGKMRTTRPSPRAFRKVNNHSYIYQSLGGKLADLQLSNSEPVFLMAEGCSGSSVFVCDVDGSWKVAMVYVGQYPHALTDFKKNIDAFLSNSLSSSRLPTTFIFGRVLCESFYSHVLGNALRVIDNLEPDREYLIDCDK